VSASSLQTGSPAAPYDSTRALPRLIGPRESTRASWQEAVERAVAFMHERMADPLALEELAHAALLSPYHFNRVFRLVTGIPPGQFLTALRMAEAKRLLLTTSQRVTDVCFAVGFESLGTFTTRFGQLVGVAPQELRRLAERHGERSVTWLADAAGAPGTADRCVSGWLEPPDGESCLTLVGLFDRAVPQGMPSACDIVARTPGPFCVPRVATGSHHLLAVGFPEARTVLDATLLEPHRLVVGALTEPIRVEPGRVGDVRVRLRMDIPGLIGPPIVLAAPLLAAEARSDAWPSLPSGVFARTA